MSSVLRPSTTTQRSPAARAFSTPRRAFSTPRRAPGPRAVIPQLESLIIQHVCPMLDSCEGLYLGDEHHQMRVFDSFLTIARTMDISNGPGYVLRALLAGDRDLAYDFAMSLDTYNTGVNLVRECVERLDALGDVMKARS